MTTDFAILNIAIHLAASKNKKYRESIVRYFETLVEFLQVNELTTRELLKTGKVPADDFKLMKSDLTDEGFEFVKRSLDKWTAKVERGDPIGDVSILERELAKIRK